MNPNQNNPFHNPDASDGDILDQSNASATNTSTDNSQPVIDFNFRDVKDDSNSNFNNPSDGQDSVEVDQESFSVPPVVTAAPTISQMMSADDYQPAPVNQFATNTKKPGRKKTFIVATVALVLVSIIGAGAAFALIYDKPQNVVGDSLTKLISADSLSLTGKAIYNNSEDNQSALIDIKSDFNQSEQSYSEFIINIDGDPNSEKIKTLVATDKLEDLYLRIEGLEEVLKQKAENDQENSFGYSMIWMVLSPFNNQWVKVSVSDLEDVNNKDTKEQIECAEMAYRNFRDDTALQRELWNVYVDNQLIDIEMVGRETVDGVGANHYVLTKADNYETRYKSYMEDVRKTRIFNQLNDCSDGELSKDMNQSKIDKGSSSEDRIDYWVSTISHEPVKLKLLSKSKEYSSELTLNMKLNTQPSFDMPKDFKTIEDLQSELKEAMNEYAPQEQPPIQITEG